MDSSLDSVLRWRGAVNSPPASVAKCGRGVLLGVCEAPDRGRVLKLVKVRCKSWQCPVCAPRKASAWRKVMVDNKPERMITLTCHTVQYGSRREAMHHMLGALSKLSTALRKLGYKYEYVRVVELTKQGWPHFHLLQRGDYISHKLLSELWVRYASSPVVHIRRVDSAEKAQAYASKYMSKAFGDVAVMYPKRRLVTKSQGWVLPQDDVAELPPSHWSLLADASLKAMLGSLCLSGCSLVESDGDIGYYATSMPDLSMLRRVDADMCMQLQSVLDRFHRTNSAEDDTL